MTRRQLVPPSSGVPSFLSAHLHPSDDGSPWGPCECRFRRDSGRGGHRVDLPRNHVFPKFPVPRTVDPLPYIDDRLVCQQ